MNKFVVLLYNGDFLGASGDEIEFCSCAVHFDSLREAQKVAARYAGSKVVPVKPVARNEYQSVHFV